MLRGILGVVLGYLAMFVVIFCTFSIAYLSMGADRAFQPGSYEPSLVWLVTSFVLGSIAAVIGGVICVAISKSFKAALALVVLMIVLGIPIVLTAMSADDPGPRASDVSNLDAMQKARQPVWVTVVNPLLGAIGVLVGAKLRMRKAV